MGVPSDPRRAGRPGREGSGVDGVGDLKNAGINPAPRRCGPPWSQFTRSQAEAILACDFFSADLLDGTQAYVLAVIEHVTRRIRIPESHSIQPERRPPSRPATSSWTSATKRIESGS